MQERQTGIWREEAPATDTAIRQLEADCKLNLPAVYLDQLRLSNGGEGTLDIEPGWVQFWPAEQVVELNQGYEVAECIPGFFGFGSNGGGELLAFKIVASAPWPIYMVPFITMDEEEAVLIADDFDSFKKAVGFEPIDADE